MKSNSRVQEKAIQIHDASKMKGKCVPMSEMSHIIKSNKLCTSVLDS